ncbi:MAG: hypothetical protein FJ221_14455 [Lentisphaerae bacterium]|nr:hypothetical protein [Lentisphaerota bacterium]
MKRCLWMVAVLAVADTVRAGPTNPPARPPPPSARVAAADPMMLQLPDMEFRQATVSEIVEWIRDRSIEADPGGVGLSVILKDDAKGTMARTRLTLGLKRPTVKRALDLLASTANLYLRRDARVLVIEPSKNVAGP